MLRPSRQLRTQVREPILGRLPSWLWIAADTMLAVLMSLGTVLPEQRIEGPGALPIALSYLLALAVTLPAAVRRVWPIPAFGVLLAASAAAALLWQVLPYSGIPLAMAAYTVGAGRPAPGRRQRVAVAMLGATLGASLVVALLGLTTPVFGIAGGQAFTTGAVVAGACVLGIATGQRRRYAEQLRAQTARSAVTQERLHIARELHDVVAHEMSVVAVQAGVARHVVNARPDEAVRALASIEEASRAGLRELRQLVSTLRSAADGAADTHAPASPALDPAPGLVDLDSLVARASQAGLPVTVQVCGTPHPLPAGLELSAYRIVQEALTNIVKHAGPARAAVLLEYRSDGLVIEVTDDGNGASADLVVGDAGDSGHGLIGMRERVAVYGGRLDASALDPPATGFRVTAVLPVEVGSA